MEILPSHLGGHMNRCHIDLESISFLKNKFGFSTGLDIGCGIGLQTELMNSIGINTIGIDGDFTVNRKIKCIIHDYSKGKIELNNIFDIGWCVEVLEHIDEKYLVNIFDTFKQCKYIICTFAPYGHKGHHHVNCKDENYWIQQFNKFGFNLDINITKELRNISSMKRDFIRQTGLFFINKDLIK